MGEMINEGKCVFFFVRDHFRERKKTLTKTDSTPYKVAVFAEAKNCPPSSMHRRARSDAMQRPLTSSKAVLAFPFDKASLRPISGVP